MRSHHLALAAAAAAAAAAASPATLLESFCSIGDHLSIPDVAEDIDTPGISHGRYPRHVAEIKLDLHAHVLGRPEETNNGLDSVFILNEAEIKEQIKVLNQAFEPARISFQHVNTSWTTHETLPPVCDVFMDIADGGEYFPLYQGDHATVNLYLLNSTSPLGGVTVRETSGRRTVFLNTNTVPGGNIQTKNMGLVAVHELAHWLGWDIHTDNKVDCLGSYAVFLNQTYEYYLEHIDDKHTCDERPKCRNYLSHAVDKCQNEFHPDQISFMRSFIQNIRKGKSPATMKQLHWRNAQKKKQLKGHGR